jgi:hypothetical protein
MAHRRSLGFARDGKKERVVTRKGRLLDRGIFNLVCTGTAELAELIPGLQYLSGMFFFKTPTVILFSAPGKDRGGVRQARASVVERARTALARKHRRGPSTPRHQARCHAMNL